jgi:poly(A) polymerase
MEPSGRIAPPDWMRRSDTVSVMAALTAEGHVARFVGGCLRDAVVGRPVSDIDIATAAAPDDVIRLLNAAGLRAVPTGKAHGTITAVANGVPYEVTTLRRDVETDGRHAVVAFTDDWAEDAARRDFTFNALYADPDGALYDPTGTGIDDARAGRVRFVGNARERIEEDVLRLLRFFRFHAHYGDGPADADALSACREMASQIGTLSAERVWAELKRLLLAPDPTPTVALMEEEGVLAYLLPEVRHVERLAALVQVETGLSVPGDVIRRLAVLVDADEAGVAAIAKRLRMAARDGARLKRLTAPDIWPEPRAGDDGNRVVLYRLGDSLFRDLVLIRAANAADSGERDVSAWNALYSLPDRAPVPGFPLSGRDIRDAGVAEGPEVGARLAEMERWWIEGGFAADRNACLERLRGLIRPS